VFAAGAGEKTVAIDTKRAKNNFINSKNGKTLYKYSHKSIDFDKLAPLFNFQSSLLDPLDSWNPS
jgi:hypothetical protein